MCPFFFIEPLSTSIAKDTLPISLRPKGSSEAEIVACALLSAYAGTRRFVTMRAKNQKLPIPKLRLTGRTLHFLASYLGALLLPE